MLRLQDKLELLKDNLRHLPTLAVAFSGGVDSTFLLKVAHEVLAGKVFVITARTFIFPEREYQEAVAFAQGLGLKHHIMSFDPFLVPGFAENPKERCYLCKKALFSQMKSVAGEQGVVILADGSNRDDLTDYRPGLAAVRELGVISPLQEVGLTKEEIRLLSQKMGLPTWQKPSLACLASRFPYGDRITKEKIAMIDQGEKYLIDLGFSQVRVRCHGNLARIEVEAEQRQQLFDLSLMDRISEKFKDIGFSYVSMDLQGYFTGSMNNFKQDKIRD